MNINQAFPGKYLKKDDFEEPKVMTIKDVSVQNVAGEGQPEEVKPVVFFAEDARGLVLNKTNAGTLEMVFKTAETDEWVGRQVEVFNDLTVVFNNFGIQSPLIFISSISKKTRSLLCNSVLR